MSCRHWLVTLTSVERHNDPPRKLSIIRDCEAERYRVWCAGTADRDMYPNCVDLTFAQVCELSAAFKTIIDEHQDWPTEAAEVQA